MKASGLSGLCLRWTWSAVLVWMSLPPFWTPEMCLGPASAIEHSTAPSHSWLYMHLPMIQNKALRMRRKTRSPLLFCDTLPKCREARLDRVNSCWVTHLESHLLKSNWWLHLHLHSSWLGRVELNRSRCWQSYAWQRCRQGALVAYKTHTHLIKRWMFFSQLRAYTI